MNWHVSKSRIRRQKSGLVSLDMGLFCGVLAKWKGRLMVMNKGHNPNILSLIQTSYTNKMQPKQKKSSACCFPNCRTGQPADNRRRKAAGERLLSLFSVTEVKGPALPRSYGCLRLPESLGIIF